MTSRIIPVEPFDLVVFGGSGDLAQRKLFPALYYRFRDEQMPEESRVVGISRRQRPAQVARVGVFLPGCYRGGPAVSAGGRID